MPKGKAAGKTASTKGRAAKAGHVFCGPKSQLKKWVLTDPIVSKNPKVKAFRTYQRLKDFISGGLVQGKTFKTIGETLGVCPSRVLEMTCQLGIKRPKKAGKGSGSTGTGPAKVTLGNVVVEAISNPARRTFKADLSFPTGSVLAEIRRMT